MESPEVWFDDVISAAVCGESTYIMLDPLFCETVEPGSIRVTSLTPSSPAMCGARVEPRSPERHLSMVVVECSAPVGRYPLPTSVTICVRGIRRGRSGVRFRKFDNEQMRRNDEFWRSAYE